MLEALTKEVIVRRRGSGRFHKYLWGIINRTGCLKIE